MSDKIYGIFQGYADDERPHSFYRTQILAEYALKILNIRNDLVYGYIKEFEINDALPKLPDTFILYGDISGQIYNGYSPEYLFNNGLLNKNQFDIDRFNSINLSLDNPLIVYPVNRNRYVVAIMYSAEKFYTTKISIQNNIKDTDIDNNTNNDIDIKKNSENILSIDEIFKEDVIKNTSNFVEQFEYIVSNIKVILDPHFIMITTNNRLHETLNIRLFSILFSKEPFLQKSFSKELFQNSIFKNDLSVQNLLRTNRLLNLAFTFLTEQFEVRVQEAFADILNKYLYRLRENVNLKQVENDILDIINNEDLEWVLRDSKDFTKCFQNVWNNYTYKIR